VPDRGATQQKGQVVTPFPRPRHIPLFVLRASALIAWVGLAAIVDAACELTRTCPPRWVDRALKGVEE